MYIVNIISDVDKLHVSLPENIFTDEKDLDISYHYDGENVVANNTKIKCPEYAARCIVCADVLTKMSNRNITNEYLYFNGSKCKNIRKVVYNISKPNKEDLRKEILLARTLLKSLVEEPRDVDESIVYCYDLICDLVKCGGINVT